MNLVARHGPSALAGTCVRGLCSHMDGCGQGLDGHHQFGDDHSNVFAGDLLLDKHGETPVSAADWLDASQARHEGVRHSQHVQQFFAHGRLHCAPRAERPLSAPSAPGAIGRFVRSRTLGKRPLKHGYGKLTGRMSALSQASIEGAI